VLTSCLACYQPFPQNGTLEHFPAGRRVAFDPERGRLWAVCSTCHRWTLAPFETRWEALEELERLTRDRGRLLAESEHVALLELGDVEVIRVGRAGLREESWWRYGRVLGQRRKDASRIALRGKIVQGVVATLFAGVPWWGSGRWFIDRARFRSFGKDAWTGRLLCPACGYEARSVHFDESGGLRLEQGPGPGGVVLRHRCPRCGEEDRGGLALDGVAAEHTLRRVLAHRNFTGAAEAEVRTAMEAIESHPSARDFTRSLAGRTPALGSLTRKGALALEIALSADVEKRLLEMELKALEIRWREEEEIAAIADRLF
jgi:hypothetical protein